MKNLITITNSELSIIIITTFLLGYLFNYLVDYIKYNAMQKQYPIIRYLTELLLKIFLLIYTAYTLSELFKLVF
jgi:hypothetical protein